MEASVTAGGHVEGRGERAGPAPAGPLVRMDQAVKRYGRARALDGLSLEVAPGEVFGFLGPNGAGKTTAVKVLLGFARLSGGSARVLGRPPGDREARRAIGYLPELFRYQEWLTANEVLELHAALAGQPHAARARDVAEALALVGLAGRGDDRVGTFSKGMQQRLGLAVALLGRPRLVFLDEPTSALDPVGRRDVRAVICALRDRGTAVFLNSHLLGEVEKVCDRVAVVNRGRIVAMGPLRAVLGPPAVRVRVTGVGPGQAAGLERFGALSFPEPDLVEVVGLEEAAVPDLVRAMVELGGRIHAVDPRPVTLEERFIELVRAT